MYFVFRRQNERRRKFATLIVSLYFHFGNSHLKVGHKHAQTRLEGHAVTYRYRLTVQTTFINDDIKPQVN